MDGLADIQQELQAVKQALRKGDGYLGMQGEPLQRYLLQLNEKENLLLSRQIRYMNADEPARPAAAAPAENGKEPHGESGTEQPQADAPVEKVDRIEPAPPPPGRVGVFDRESLDSVLKHLRAYESMSAECIKGLRALSSLAYADAQKVGDTDGCVDTVVRTIAIHQDDPVVRMAAMRALCNMAYSQKVALTRLSEPAVMSIFLDAMTSGSSQRDLEVRGSEAIARVVAASQGGVEGDSPPPEGTNGTGGLAALFTAASGGKQSWQEVVPKLIAELVVNEVVVVEPVADAFVLAGRWSYSANMAASASNYLQLAKLLSGPDCACQELPQALVDRGAIGAAAELMQRCESDGQTQLSGIEALSSLVGSRWGGLVAFAEVGGMLRIEAAMRAHGDHQVLQTKGIRALASGIAWPLDIQNKAQYSHTRAITLTKAAMSKHVGNAELQTAALEGLSKYLDKGRYVEEVREDGLTGLVKAVMTKHSTETKVMHWGRSVLGALGDDKNWTPLQQRE